MMGEEDIGERKERMIGQGGSTSAASIGGIVKNREKREDAVSGLARI